LILHKSFPTVLPVIPVWNANKDWFDLTKF